MDCWTKFLFSITIFFNQFYRILSAEEVRQGGIISWRNFSKCESSFLSTFVLLFRSAENGSISAEIWQLNSKIKIFLKFVQHQGLEILIISHLTRSDFMLSSNFIFWKRWHFIFMPQFFILATSLNDSWHAGPACQQTGCGGCAKVPSCCTHHSVKFLWIEKIYLSKFYSIFHFSGSLKMTRFEL